MHENCCGEPDTATCGGCEALCVPNSSVRIGSFDGTVYQPGACCDGYCYKSEEAFNAKEGICYICESSFENGNVIGELTIAEAKSEGLSYSDLLTKAHGNEKTARWLFDYLGWTQTAIEDAELRKIGYFICPDCGRLIDSEEKDTVDCPD